MKVPELVFSLPFANCCVKIFSVRRANLYKSLFNTLRFLEITVENPSLLMFNADPVVDLW